MFLFAVPESGRNFIPFLLGFQAWCPEERCPSGASGPSGVPAQKSRHGHPSCCACCKACSGTGQSSSPLSRWLHGLMSAANVCTTSLPCSLMQGLAAVGPSAVTAVTLSSARLPERQQVIPQHICTHWLVAANCLFLMSMNCCDVQALGTAVTAQGPTPGVAQPPPSMLPTQVCLLTCAPAEMGCSSFELLRTTASGILVQTRPGAMSSTVDTSAPKTEVAQQVQTRPQAVRTVDTCGPLCAWYLV